MAEQDIDKPQCGKHPDARVLKAKNIRTNRNLWICLHCGDSLGDAGAYVESKWENMDYG